MINRIRFLTYHFIFCVFMFSLFRLAFLGYHNGKLAQLPFNLIPGILVHGLHLDLSAAAWLSFIPLLMVYLSGLFSFRVFKLLYRVMMCTFLLMLTIITIADMEIFNAWGTRMDATVIRYLSTPSEAFAASNAAPFGLLLLAFIVLLLILVKVYTKFIDQPVVGFKPLDRWDFLLLPAFVVGLVIAARGGFQQIPINSSFAYFSNNDFANQSAINQHWHFFSSSWLAYQKKEKPFDFMSDDEAEQIVSKLYHCDAEKGFQRVLTSDRPNIILILWESLTANAIGQPEGTKKVIPEFEKLIEQGVYFSRIYSSGDRTSKGLPAVISGYPAQPASSIIMNSKKTKGLPSLAKVLKQNGYSTSFYYGGELEFDNMKAFLTGSDFAKIVGRNDFPANLSRSKWGAHDHDVFNRVSTDLKNENNPFFCTILTLSSHEPFEVPAPNQFPGKDHESMFKNSLNYVDHSVASFIASIKTEGWYDNTLIIITGDHGTPLIGDFARSRPEKFHIPLLFAGGALAKRGLVVDKVGSQQDLAATVLAQLDLGAEDFKFSRNLLSFTQNYPFAVSFFNNGIIFINTNGYLAFDNHSRSLINKDTLLSDEDQVTAKALMQFTFKDYLNR